MLLKTIFFLKSSTVIVFNLFFQFSAARSIQFYQPVTCSHQSHPNIIKINTWPPDINYFASSFSTTAFCPKLLITPQSYPKSISKLQYFWTWK